MKKSKCLFGLILGCLGFVNYFRIEAQNTDASYLGDLGVIVVTPTRTESTISDLPTNVDVITKDEIVRSNALTAAEVLENALGITEVNRRGTRGSSRSIRIRSGGDTSKQVLVLIDGQPVNDVSLGSADLEEIPADFIERIEIIRGPNSALWGANALGGVINIITKKQIKEELVKGLSFQVGSFATHKYNLNIGVKRGSRNILLSASKDISDGWRENSDYTGNDMIWKLGYDLKHRGNLGLSLIYHQSEFGLPGKNTTPFKNYDGSIERKAQSPDARMKKNKKYVHAEYKNNFGEESLLKVDFYGNFVEKRYKYPSGSTDDLSLSSSYGVEVQINTAFGIVTGVNIRNEGFKRKDMISSPAKNVINEDIAYKSIFMQKTISFDQLTAILGIRYDYHSVFSGQTNPRLSFVYRASDILKLSANAGRAFSAPTFEDIYSPYTSWPASAWGPAGDTKGNTDLKPESAWGYDMGIEHCIKNFITRLTLFRNDIDDLIAWDEVDPDPNFDKWRPSNIGKAYNQGIELEMTHRIFRELSQGISYTYLVSKGKKEGQNLYKTLMYSPPHRFNYRTYYESQKGLNLNLSVNYTHKVRWEDDYGSIHKLPGYTLVKAGIGQKLHGIKLVFKVDNILNRKYQSREDYPLPGRIFYGGANLTF